MQAVAIVLPIFMIIGIGWVLRHKGLLSPQTLKENNFVLYWFAIPAVLIRGIFSANMDVLANPYFIVAVWLPYPITLTLAWMSGRHEKRPQRFATLILSATRGNHFFAGLPIVWLAMGNVGLEAGTVILAFSMVIMQLLSIAGAQLAMFEKLSWVSIKATAGQLLRNPLFMTCLFALIMVFADLNHLPQWLDKTLEIIGDISTGLALLALGAGLRFDNIFLKVLSVWKIATFKLLVHPAITFAISCSLDLSTDMIRAGTLLAAMPVAINTAIIAQQMDMDNEYCSNGIAITTLFSILSLPLWISALGLA